MLVIQVVDVESEECNRTASCIARPLTLMYSMAQISDGYGQEFPT